LECLEEAGCRCKLSVPRPASRDVTSYILRAAPAQPHRSSGIWGQTIALRNPQKLTQLGVAALTYPGKTANKYAIKSQGCFWNRSLPSPLFSHHPPLPTSSSSSKNAHRAHRPTLFFFFFRSLRRRIAAVEQSPRVVLTRAGSCRKDTAGSAPRSCSSRIGIDKRGNSDTTQTRTHHLHHRRHHVRKRRLGSWQ
jgi:hypothetical protein